MTIDPATASRADKFIDRSQVRLRSVPNDDSARLELAQAFLQKQGEAADPTFYAKAGVLLRDLRARRPRDPRVAITSGIRALSMHQFATALGFGQRALQLAPKNATAYGILVDANNELGRYDRALRANQAMADMGSTLPALTRISYARELRGDLDGALLALDQAITAAGSAGGADVAYALSLRGHLLLATGDTDGAAGAYAAAEAAEEGYAPAVAGRAQVLVARNQIPAAIPLLTQLTERLPVAQYATDLGDALSAAGRTIAARRAYRRARELDQRELELGVDVRVEMAAFSADHHPGPKAVADARAALAVRPSLLAHDVLAWNLYRVGKFDEAATESRRALALGSRDPREQFHAAAIAFAQGNRTRATQHFRVVLSTNPRFDAFLLPEIEKLGNRLNLRVPS